MSTGAPSRADTDPTPPTGVPRLLGPAAPVDFADHLARYGPLPTVRSRSERAALVEAVERSTLLGRGGGGFPAGRKLRSVAEHGRHTIVVANGAEGEPASHKDAVLLTHAPHLVIDGAIVAARAVRADEIIVVVDRENAAVCAAVDSAIAQRSGLGGGHSDVPVRRVGVPSRYVAGEESAVVSFLNGGPAKPTSVPPRPYERGVRGRPTLVQNVETLAHIALIARYGVDWFQTVGPLDESGSMLVTVSGAVARPGVYELALGMPMPDVLAAVGGTTDDMSALLAGGYFGNWIPAPAVTGLVLSRRSFAAAGGSLGCGMLHVFPARACGVRESARVARVPRGGDGGTVRPLHPRIERDRRNGRDDRETQGSARRVARRPAVAAGCRPPRRLSSPRCRGGVPHERAERVRRRVRAPRASRPVLASRHRAGPAPARSSRS